MTGRWMRRERFILHIAHVPQVHLMEPWWNLNGAIAKGVKAFEFACQWVDVEDGRTLVSVCFVLVMSVVLVGQFYQRICRVCYLRGRVT